MTEINERLTTINGKCYEGMTAEEAKEANCYKKNIFYKAFEEVDTNNDGVLQREEIIETRRQEYEVRNKYATAASVFSEGALLLCLATIPAGGLVSGVGAAVTGVASATSHAIKAHYDNLNDETIRASLDVYQ